MKLKQLDLQFKRYYPPDKPTELDLSNFKPYLTHVFNFLQKCDQIKNKELRTYLCEKHFELFEELPTIGLPLYIVKSRIAYRLQYESHRIQDVPMTKAFEQNYNAMMQFNEVPKEYFKGCTPDRQEMGYRLLFTYGFVSNTAVARVTKMFKDVTKIAKKADKIREHLKELERITSGSAEVIGGTPKISTNIAPSKRIKVLDKYAATQIIYWFSKKANASIDTIKEIFSTLKIPLSSSSFVTYASHCSQGLPNVTPEDEKILLELMKKC